MPISLPHIFASRICESFYCTSNGHHHIAQRLHGMGEYRHDLSLPLHSAHITQIAQALPQPLIFTCRACPTQLSEQARSAAYLSALQAGYKYIDLDYSTDTSILQQLSSTYTGLGERLILSRHFYEAMPSDTAIAQLIAEIQKQAYSHIKIAVHLECKADMQRLQAWQHKRQDIVFVGMGPHALAYRAWSLVHTATPFTYTALLAQQQTVAHQPNYQQLAEQITAITTHNSFFATVIGQEVQHSQSPQLFNSYVKQEGITQAYYHKSNVSAAAQIPHIMQSYHAFNITAPYKQAIMAFLHHISPAATAIGAANTAYKKAGEWHGDNTDYLGILACIADFRQSIKKVLILGAGGAARAAAYAMQKAGKDIYIINRTHQKAHTVATTFGGTALQHVEALQSYELIINTTPTLPAALCSLLPSYTGIALDAIYPSSVLAAHLKHRQATLIRGERWLKAQADAAFQHFFAANA